MNAIYNDEDCETLAVYPGVLVDADKGVSYIARACGRPRLDDGMWEGFVEFERDDGVSAEPIRTDRETSQPNRVDLLYWARGLTEVYLEGAFQRATQRSGTFKIPVYLRVTPGISM
jgi:hypothetical protein